MNESGIVTERKGVEDKMDDNENYIECSKMNFSQFTNPFAGPNQFTAGKFPQNLTTTASNGQVLGLVSGSEGAMQFLRPVDGTAVSAASAMFHQQQSQHGQVVTTAGMPHPAMASPAYITLPITMPGAKPGDAQQTVQIQVLNPNPLPSQMAGSGAAGQTGQTGSAQSGTLPTPKFQMGQMQIPIQGFQQGTTVLTVAYSPQDEEVLHNQGLPEGMTIVAALQPQDLQLLASQNPGSTTILQQHQQQQSNLSSNNASSPGGVKIDSENPPPLRQIKQESPAIWNQPSLVPTSMHSTSNIIEMVQQQQQQQHQLHHLQQQQQQQQSRPPQNLNLQPYLKFNNNNNGTNPAMTTIMNGSHVLQQLVLPTGVTIAPGIIKQEVPDDHSNENTQFGPADSTGQGENGTDGSPDGRSVPGINGREHENEPGENGDGTGNGTTPSGKARKKRKYKTKPPKPKRQKPGQVHIATAIDGTVLFCCPECHMAYPEKECLEQHLVVHKIERRFICDICGAGLKRKEHLERHKLGHNPERPFICNVCEKGFKRKEHLNLHYVIHSGVKTEICNDCGKGFYRKDHLRKHIKSHLTKRLKEEKASNRNNNNNNNNNNRNTSNGANTTTTTIANGAPSTSIASLPTGIPSGLTITTTSGSMQSGTGDSVDATAVGQSAASQQNSSTQNLLQSAISLPQGVTIHVPTADNQTLPVQISLPHLVAQQQTDTDGSTRTVLVSNSPESLNHLHSTISTTTTTTSSSSSTPASSAL
ncbi:transcription factor Sp3-like isoform X1 [Anopheles moucheti]|uniref:transcription factor Sp3-like isoform X1 n=3 Tax=Anopheles moucheti TaxID=186751 RepID=UPI0022F0358A|nr:transcription factor Sp3-like isoform X1 [Anopheles moucheti]